MITLLAGVVPGFVTTGIMSPALSVVVEGSAEILESHHPREGIKSKRENSFFIETPKVSCFRFHQECKCHLPSVGMNRLEIRKCKGR